MALHTYKWKYVGIQTMLETSDFPSKLGFNTPNGRHVPLSRFIEPQNV